MLSAIISCKVLLWREDDLVVGGTEPIVNEDAIGEGVLASEFFKLRVMDA